jgi:hypothetical protein
MSPKVTPPATQSLGPAGSSPKTSEAARVKRTISSELFPEASVSTEFFPETSAPRRTASGEVPAPRRTASGADMDFHADAARREQVRKKLMTDSASGAYERRAEGRELQGCKDEFGQAQRRTPTAERKLPGSEVGKGDKGKK